MTPEGRSETIVDSASVESVESLASIERRTLLVAVGTTAVSLGGCLGRDGPSVDPNAPPEEQIDQHLDGANTYDGDILDRTGQAEVTVQNGESSDGYAFDPPAVRVDTGTTVVWEWSGGAPHSVTHDNGDSFDSGIESGDGTTWSHTFESAGLYLYICRPHQAVQRGAILAQ